MRIVQTTEARTRLAELLRTVEKGETVAITRRGRMIAHMVPASREANPASHRRAMKRFLRCLDKLEPCCLSIEDIVSAKNEGRRMTTARLPEPVSLAPVRLPAKANSRRAR